MTTLIHNSKKTKLRSKLDIESEGRDRISDLPDVILHNIFSFLPMTDVMRTCILAKRWQNVWISAPNLIFDDQKTDMRTPFLDLVERALLLRDSSINKFSLRCKSPVEFYNASRFRQLISAALRHKVQELDIKGRGSLEHLLLPPRFTCESLVSLTLNLGFNVKFPSSTWFPNLKRLNLKRVGFSDQHSAQQFFNGCPTLEELTIMNCPWENVRDLNILSVALRKLEIVNDKLFVNTSNYCKIWIKGQNLESFSFLGALRDHYIIDGASLIAQASVEIWGSTLLWDDRAHCAGILLNGLSSVYFLELSGSSFEALIDVYELHPDLIVFTNLTHLKVTKSEEFCDWRALRKILKITPSLGNICFEKGIGLGMIYEPAYEWLSVSWPQCFSTHLKTIIIGFVGGCETDIKAIKMLLEHATVLEKLVIVSVLENDDECCQRIKQIQEEILLLPRTSIHCVIEYQ